MSWYLNLFKCLEFIYSQYFHFFPRVPFSLFLKSKKVAFGIFLRVLYSSTQFSDYHLKPRPKTAKALYTNSCKLWSNLPSPDRFGFLALLLIYLANRKKEIVCKKRERRQQMKNGNRKKLICKVAPSTASPRQYDGACWEDFA